MCLSYLTELSTEFIRNLSDVRYHVHQKCDPMYRMSVAAIVVSNNETC